MKKLIFGVVWLLLAVRCQAEIITVDANGFGDFETIQAAIDDSNDGDIIIVAEGIYTGHGNRFIHFRGKAITVRSTDPNDPNVVATTIIYPEYYAHGFYFYNSEDANSVLAGLTITNANGAIRCEGSSPTITNCMFTNADNGAILCSRSSPTITNCTISNNTSNYEGGAIHCYDKSSPTITNCTISNNSGGGIYCYDESSPTITNCTISNNSGGGIHCKQRSNPTIDNCILNDNSAYEGGAIYCDDESNLKITDCTITENTAQDGAGIFCEYDSSLIITNSIITNNRAEYGGGGIHCWNNSNLIITNCIVTGNTAQDGGGGIYLLTGKASASITDSTIMNNSSNYGGGILCLYTNNVLISNCNVSENSAIHGGGICCCAGDNSTTIINSIINGNKTKWWGGGIYSDGPNTKITNCTITNNNTVKGDGGGVQGYDQGIITNCIFWKNSPQQIYMVESVTYSNVQGGYPGLGNIDTDPCFVSPGYWAHKDDPNLPVEPNDPNATWTDGDYHLKSEGWRWDSERQRWDYDNVTSRCIDAGNPGSPLEDELLSVPDDPNNIWGENLRINMGAYGGTEEASMPPYDWDLLADLTNNGIVNLEDFAAQALYWLLTQSEQPGDLNRDGTVNTMDLALLTKDWLNQTIWYEP